VDTPDNPYAVLGVRNDATPDSIRRAYFHLAYEHHPDRNGGSPEAEQRMRSLNPAFAALGSEGARAATDERLRQARHPEAAARRPVPPPPTVPTPDTLTFGDIAADFFTTFAAGVVGRTIDLVEAGLRAELKRRKSAAAAQRQRRRQRARRLSSKARGIVPR
jgi:curved DNA-binding protein CbpA